MDQRTDEWYAQRCGLVTASRIGDLMAKTKSGYSATRANYMAQLVVERLTGEVAESYTNAAMQWGIDTEPFAREAYEILTGELVEEVGFIKHPSLVAGASPDGLVGEKGLIEIKCPNTATHLEFLLNPKIDKKYMLQMQFQMMCTGRDWCDFVSYDPRVPNHLKYKCVRVEFDGSLAEEITQEVHAFSAELCHKLKALQEMEE